MRLSASFGFFWKVSHFRMIFSSLRSWPSLLFLLEGVALQGDLLLPSLKPIFLLLELCSSRQRAAFAVWSERLSLRSRGAPATGAGARAEEELARAAASGALARLAPASGAPVG